MTQLESFPNAIPDDGSFNSSRYEDEEGSMMSGAFRNSTVNRNNRRESGADLHVTLARPERMAVRVLRVFVLLAMVGAALAVSLSVYFMMKTDEETAHDQDFDDLSRRLLDGFLSNTRLSVQTMDMLALSFTSSVIDSNQTWPFVTLNDVRCFVIFCVQCVLFCQKLTSFTLIPSHSRGYPFPYLLPFSSSLKPEQRRLGSFATANTLVFIPTSTLRTGWLGKTTRQNLIIWLG